MSADTVTQQYWGWTIETHAGQDPDGNWTAHALLRPGAAHSAGTGVQQFQASAATEDAARSAALARATAAADQARIASGKP